MSFRECSSSKELGQSALMGKNACMSNWLPSHQSHMLYTLAHADGAIERMGDALYDYLQVGPFELESRIRDGVKK